MSTTVERETLTPRQEERRRRVIQAAMRLGSEGGYEAVQMRDVAQTADVALGTIYRYFSSKDHLLAAALSEWTGELQQRLKRTPPRGETAADQMVDVLRRACRALERQPRLTAALIRALGTADDNATTSAREVTIRINEMAEGILDHLDPATRDAATAVVRHVWYSSLTAWANGRIDIGQVGDELEQATRLILACHDRRPDGNGGRARR